MDSFKSRESNSSQSQGVGGGGASSDSLKKIIITIVATLALSTLFSFGILYKPMSSVEGVWVRQPDDNEMANGMIIVVRKEGAEYVGQIIANDDQAAMETGFIKWKGFQKDSLNVFAHQDASLSYDVSERGYMTSYTFMTWDRKKLIVYCPEAAAGRHQVYIRQ